MRTLLLVMGALAILSLGAAGASAAPRQAPPCHEMGGNAPAPDHHAPAKAMKVMACCAACVVAPAPETPTGAKATLSRASVAPAPTLALPGRRLTPEPAPPRP